MNALADEKVAEYVNEHCIATYLKVGTFQVVNGQKVGGNVASYFCVNDGAVVHAVAGPVDAQVFLSEAPGRTGHAQDSPDPRHEAGDR